MTADKARRRSRWMLRALEWNDPRARYPNLWVDGMPVHSRLDCGSSTRADGMNLEASVF